jgi:hypothetical protein
MLDPRELEEKLERDNLTLKEQISKLQSTIKQIKSEITAGNPISNKNETKEDNHLKFSFNGNNYKQEFAGNNHNSSNNIYSNITCKSVKPNCLKETTPKKESEHQNHNHNNHNKDLKLKKNIYSDNLEKIRKEKQIINEMEEFKKRANLKKTFSDEELDGTKEINKFHKNYKNERNFVKVNAIEIDELKESYRDNKDWGEQSENYPKNEIKKNYEEYEAPNFEKAKIKAGRNSDSIKDYNYDQRYEDSDGNSKSLREKNAKFENNRSVMNHETNMYKSDSWDQEEDSFEMKVKSLDTNNSKSGICEKNEKDKSKKTNRSKHSSNLSNFSNHNSNKLIQKNNKIQLKESPKNKTKKIETGINSSFNNLNKTNSKSKVTTTKPPENRPKSSKRNVASQKGIQTNPSIVKKENKDKSNSDSLISTKKIEDMNYEIIQLKKEIERLKSENMSLKSNLEHERIQSSKIKNFAEEILKFYNK